MTLFQINSVDVFELKLYVARFKTQYIVEVCDYRVNSVDWSVGELVKMLPITISGRLM